MHADQRRTDVTTQVVPGGTVTERWVPVARVGLYVPGGLAMYPSTVVMNVVPAQVAGVESLVVASPPQADNGGLPDARVLAACALLGVDEVYAVGGAQAIAMLGYGSDGADESDRCEPVDMITGPGNIWVTAAKRLLRGVVGIDAEAGPTEIAILADDTADPVHVAADLISQAEHDPLAASVLVTAVARRWSTRSRPSWPGRCAATKHSERVTAALTGAQSGAVLVDDLEQGLRVVDAYAAEHLEIQTRDARDAGRCGYATPARSSSAPYVAGVARRLLRRLQPRAAHRRLRPALLAGCRCSRSCAASTWSSTTRRRCATSPATWSTLANAEDLPAHGQAVHGPVPGGSDRDQLDDLPLRDELRGRPPYGAPQLDVAGAAEHQRELVPAARRRGGGDRQGAARPSCATSTATRTATRWRCAPTWPPTSGTG